MNRLIRLFLVFEAATFFAAAAIHLGGFIPGYGHRAAGTAESVIGSVLWVGLLVSWARPAWTRASGLAAQAFALLGTFVGVTTIIIGIGPRTVPDVAYHISIIIVMVLGLIFAARARTEDIGEHPPRSSSA
jgi:hypothetical protein